MTCIVTFFNQNPRLNGFVVNLLHASWVISSTSTIRSPYTTHESQGTGSKEDWRLQRILGTQSTVSSQRKLYQGTLDRTSTEF